MTPNWPRLIRLLAPVTVFASVLAVLAAINSGGAASGERAAAASSPSSAFPASTDGRLAQARLAIRQDPSSADAVAAYGTACVQKARETGDPRGTWHARAARAFRSALRRDPRHVDATIGLGTLALSAHDFSAGLTYGLRARRLAPQLVRPYAVVVDAEIELGRYRRAARSLQRMIDLKPNLASYARASYFRELHGDTEGALEAMRLAVSAGGDAAEQVAYVQTLLGDLLLHTGRVEDARDAYQLALIRLPGYVDARFGLARAQVQDGALAASLAPLRRVVRDRPDPDHLLLLAEVELRLGMSAPARVHVERARATERRALRTGSRADAGVALLEASYGRPADAVEIARRVWDAAPSVTSADALGYALTRAGRPEAGLRYARIALRLGTRSPSFHYHAGMAALGAGREGAARRHLETALALNPRFSPVDAPRARRALATL